MEVSFYGSRSEQLQGLLRMEWKGAVRAEISTVVHSVGIVLALGPCGDNSLSAGLAMPPTVSSGRHSR
jgi:hypothetical protein